MVIYLCLSKEIYGSDGIQLSLLFFVYSDMTCL